MCVCVGAANRPGWECAEEHEQNKVVLAFPLLSYKLPALLSQTVKVSHMTSGCYTVKVTMGFTSEGSGTWWSSVTEF